MMEAEPEDPNHWDAALQRAHAVWPAAWVPAPSFVEYLRARLTDAAEATSSELAVPDLYLACACALGVAPALDAFTRTMLPGVDAHLTRFDPSPAFKDEVRQLLATKLLVAAAGETPAIAD